MTEMREIVFVDSYYDIHEKDFNLKDRKLLIIDSSQNLFFLEDGKLNSPEIKFSSYYEENINCDLAPAVILKEHYLFPDDVADMIFETFPVDIINYIDLDNCNF